MSYDIRIGEAVLDVPSADAADEYGDNELTVQVKPARSRCAPSFPGDFMTGRGNCRSPGYSQWTNFCREAGLYDLFFDEEAGLMRRHPGCFLLRPAHLVRVGAARKVWEQAHPGKVPGWDPDLDGFGHDKTTGQKRKPDPKYDGVLARLIWLEWWMGWALKRCKVPAIFNR